MKSVKFWLGLVISGVLIYFAFRGIEWTKLKAALIGMNYWWLVACVPIFFLQYVIRALRWDYLLRPIKKVPYSSLIASTVIGFTGNLLLPARLGEIIRAVDLGRREDISKTSVLATLVLERVLDGLAIIPLFIGSALVLGMFEAQTEVLKWARTGLFVFSGAYLAIIVIIIGLVIRPQTSLSLTRKCTGFLPGRVSEIICGLMENVVEGLMLVRSPRLLLAAAGYTIVLWVMLSLPFLFLSYGVGYPVSMAGAFFANGLTCLVIAIPSAPGFVGTMHWAIKVAFADALMAMPAADAGVLALVFHGGTFVFTVLYCLTFLVRGDVSLLDLGRAAEAEK